MDRVMWVAVGSVAARVDGPRRLQTAADVDRLLREHFPPVDDPAARVALVAAYAHRHQLRTTHRRIRLVRGMFLLGAGLLLLIACDPRAGARLQRLVRRR